MKKFILTLITALTLISSSAYAETAKVSVNGLVCDFCARALEKVFSRQEAVENINVDLDSKIITVQFKEGQSLDDATLKALITDAGYNMEGINRE